MEFRYLGNSGFKISEITYGNWLTHGSQVENDQAKACVRAALDAGISTFDTADAYANTMAETVLGEALKGERRESVELAYALRHAGRPRAAAATCLRAALQTGPSLRLGAELVKAAGRCVAGPPREGSA